jgi:hypothetical protein
MSSSTTPKTVLLKGNPIRKEAAAGGTITPGHLVARANTGKFVVQASADIDVAKAFALEADLIGKGIDDNYAADDQVQVAYCRPGDEIYALLPANAAAVVIGDFLQSNGNGALKKLASGVAIAVALEAVDNSGGATPARIKVEVI